MEKGNFTLRSGGWAFLWGDGNFSLWSGEGAFYDEGDLFFFFWGGSPLFGESKDFINDGTGERLNR